MILLLSIRRSLHEPSPFVQNGCFQEYRSAFRSRAYHPDRNEMKPATFLWARALPRNHRWIIPVCQPIRCNCKQPDCVYNKAIAVYNLSRQFNAYRAYFMRAVCWHACKKKGLSLWLSFQGAVKMPKYARGTMRMIVARRLGILNRNCLWKISARNTATRM